MYLTQKITDIHKNGRFFSIALVGVLLISIQNEVQASEKKTYQPGSSDLLTVFLDFSYHQQFVRETITFVNYVRDRELAQVHILITRHGSGSAGENYVISFIGRRRFEGMNNTLTYWAPGNNTLDETRRGLVNILRMGLVPYIANTDMINQISLNVREVTQVEREVFEDPWNNWVIEIYGGANFFKEASQSRFDSRWGFSADQISEQWKVRFRPYFNLNERKFIRNEKVILSRNKRHGLSSSVILSINQHWSAGLFGTMLSSTFNNIQFNLHAGPGIEYSFYPYREASSKAVTLVYRLAAGNNHYIERTVFGKMEETLTSQSVDFSARFQQPWGSFRASISGSHYFHDFRSNSASVSSRLDLRIIKGLSLNLSGNLDFINDLVALPAGELSLEEILLQQRRQATSYQMSGAIGLAYSFGSQFTNVVNTRF
jgi:hypothetical protein